MFCTLEVKLDKGQITSIVVHTGNFQTFTVTTDASWFKDIIPTLGIPMDSEGAAFAEGTPHTQFSLAQLVTLSTVDKEMRLSTNTLCGCARKISNDS